MASNANIINTIETYDTFIQHVNEIYTNFPFYILTQNIHNYFKNKHLIT